MIEKAVSTLILTAAAAIGFAIVGDGSASVVGVIAVCATLATCAIWGVKSEELDD